MGATKERKVIVPVLVHRVCSDAGVCVIYKYVHTFIFKKKHKIL